MFRSNVLFPVAAALSSCDSSDGMTVCKALDYVGDGDSSHKMDLYLPAGTSTNLPAVVWAQGSAFRGLPYDSPGMSGAKNYPCKQLTEVGIACAAISYRGSAWPAQHQDIRAAVRWLRGQGRQGNYGLGGKIGAHGSSSGGNMAGHIWSSGHLEDEVFGSDFARIGPFPTETAAVAAAAIYWPQYHNDPDDEPACEYSEKRANPHGPSSESTYVKNSKDIVKKMSGETYLDSSTPPAYMVHGTADQQVSPCNTVEAYELAMAKGIDVNVTYVKGGDHGCAERGPVWWNGCTNCHGPDPDVLKVMLAFFQRNLKGVDPPTPPTPPTPPAPPTPTPAPSPMPSPTPAPTPGAPSATCQQCLVQGCPMLKDTGSAECYTCLDAHKGSCAASCHSASYTFDQLKSWYCDAKSIQV